ncbi:MAG: RnfH family protein [Methylococcales bacterium]|jgi:uncharacterized protein|nr:RnfH family protein [Methylococcales bacterium]MBT7445095.1 RnfH family protein [Methylococcales bacterium]
MLVEVMYALPEQQVCLSLEVDDDCTIEQAIHASGILSDFPEIDVSSTKVGVFSMPKKDLSEVLSPSDRVEIYRPLLIDPKEIRKIRAAKAKKDKEAKEAEAAKVAKAQK